MTIAVAFAVVSLGLVEEMQAGSRAEAGNEGDVYPTVQSRLLSPHSPGPSIVCEWPNPYGTGHRLVTDHYMIYATFLEPELLEQVPRFVESAHKAYNASLPHSLEPRTRSSIYLFANRAQWEAFTRDETGSQAEVFLKIQEGAYCSNGRCIGYDIGPERTLAALGHEGWHQFTSRHFAFRLPSWLDEGVAVTFESFTDRDGAFQFTTKANPYRLGRLRVALDHGEWIPLKVLLAISPGEVMATDPSERVQVFYSQSYALVRFLQEAAGSKYLSRYHRLVADGLKGQWPLESTARAIASDRNVPKTIEWNRLVGPWLFRYYVTDDLDGIESQYRAFCVRLVAR
jgi:hypothetical protein